MVGCISAITSTVQYSTPIITVYLASYSGKTKQIIVSLFSLLCFSILYLIIGYSISTLLLFILIISSISSTTSSSNGSIALLHFTSLNTVALFSTVAFASHRFHRIAFASINLPYFYSRSSG